MNYKAGDTLYGYKLLQWCGEGAYGSVFLAEDAIGTRVAIKILPNCGRYSGRELAGLKNYKECNHPNLLKIRHIEIHDDLISYTMDAADDLHHGKGKYLADTLANRLNLFKRLDGKEVSDMLAGLLAGLEELHDKGLVHRDIKPDNILWVNGRPTLADAGLIAREGPCSFVGTPGFISPKLLAGEGNADASDDFYALGKVIYCALTGNPVEEYPSVPKEVTISMDANLGYAYRESCKHPVHSSAEFRKLLAPRKLKTDQKPHPVSPKRHMGSLTWAILLTALFGIALLLWKSRRPSVPGETAVKQPEIIVGPNGCTRLKKTGLQDPEYAADQQKNVLALLNGTGYFRENRLDSLLNYRPMSSAEIMERLNYSNENPRLDPNGLPRRVSKNSTPAENALLLLFAESTYPDMDTGKLRERQAYWRKQPGPPLAVQQKMLKTDPVMQSAAIDQFIRNTVNTLLSRNSFNAGDEKHLKTILLMRLELLNPEFGQVLYLNRLNNL